MRSAAGAVSCEGGKGVEKFDIFQDIAERTGGDIYVGVVGPVRTGKSTFIKRFVELLVLPNISNAHDRERAKDALPQGGAGRTVTTTEPKFVPDDGVEITIKDNITFKVRLVDCVGYAVEGALGYEEDRGPRMVMTPWFDYEVPFHEAAEVGTRKVIAEHSTIGLVVTTDGSFGDLAREAFVPSEKKVIDELKELGKPFVVVLNTADPDGEVTLRLARELELDYDVPVIPIDCAGLEQEGIYTIFEQVLYEFPVKEVNIHLPKWVEELDRAHWLRGKFEIAVRDAVAGIRRLRDVDGALERLGHNDFVDEVYLRNMDLGSGVATVDITAKEELFYQVLEEMSGYALQGKEDVLRMMKELVYAKHQYDKVADALREVRETGYGLVPPSLSEMTFDEPELIRRGTMFGVRLRASAPSLHMIRADVQTEVTPLMGTEKQCEELVQYLLAKFEDDPKKLWQSDIFGKSLNELVKEGIQNKLFRMPENAQQKLQETLQRIINEGSGGLICIII